MNLESVSANELIVGIDLGTTNSCIACVLDGDVHVIPDESPDASSLRRCIPRRWISHRRQQAQNEVVVDPVNTVMSAKRLIGRSFTSAAVQRAIQDLPYRVIKGDALQPFIEL